jgi:hypothetical protein
MDMPARQPLSFFTAETAAAASAGDEPAKARQVAAARAVNEFGHYLANVPGQHVLASDLWDHYIDFCELHDHEAMEKAMLASVMRSSTQIKCEKLNGVWHYLDVRLEPFFEINNDYFEGESTAMSPLDEEIRRIEVAQFASEHLVRRPGSKASLNDVARAYSDFCYWNGLYEVEVELCSFLEGAGFPCCDEVVDNQNFFHDTALVNVRARGLKPNLAQRAHDVFEQHDQARCDLARILKLIDAGASPAAVRHAIADALESVSAPTHGWPEP